jgi:hypothetical protein
MSEMGSGMAQVLAGESPYVLMEIGGESRLVVPLRVASRVHGALVFVASLPAALTESHVEDAQRLADIAAAHLELLRRTVIRTPPTVPNRAFPRKNLAADERR